MKFNQKDLKYLALLSEKYPTVESAATEIINLNAILNLPKGTEHVLSDIHGEAEQFFHILKNGSGVVRTKIDEEFGTELNQSEKKHLATIIYYPDEKLNLIKKNDEAFYRDIFNKLLRLCRRVQTKYTRSKVRKALPKDFSYILEELIYQQADVQNKEGYYNEIISCIISTGQAKAFTVALCELIQRLVIDRLHIVGDIFDRGSGAALIMERLIKYHSVDIQWGNHDLLWMGAAAGNLCCIANVIRISARYGNIKTLEEDYGINMLPLSNFAGEVYAQDSCEMFKIRKILKKNTNVSRIEEAAEEKMHKAIAIIQFKLESQAILRNRDFKMEERLLLDKIDYKNGRILIDGKFYELLDKNFPTVDPENPYELTVDEKEIIIQLKNAFLNCEKLQKHIEFLFNKGSLYLLHNDNLYYHACIPFNKDGSFKEVEIAGVKRYGKELYDYLEKCIRKGYFYETENPEKQRNLDMMWYIWCNKNSPVFGKDKMATFERYFLEDKYTHRENKDSYYTLIEREDICDKILKEFGLDPKKSHIINGHMPVKSGKGEKPFKCGGKLLVIDGGFAKAYQKTTGIAGYTLIYNSYGLRLVAHEPFENTYKAIINETDIRSDTTFNYPLIQRKMVEDTDNGRKIADTIKDLEKLVEAYREGFLKENK